MHRELGAKKGLFGSSLRPEMFFYFFLIIAVSLGKGFSDTLFSNYFKEAYDVTTVQRGFIEFPRELPGVLCALIISFMSPMGDTRIAFFAQLLTFAGITLMAIFTPSYAVMLVMVFTYSLGYHVFMPTQSSVGLALAEPDKVGKRMGQYASVQSAMGFIAAIITFFGFRYGLLSFKTEIKWVFVMSAAVFAFAVFASAMLLKKTDNLPKRERKRTKMVFRKEYKYFYLLTMLTGVQRQITLVYGTWVIVDLMMKGADTMSLLTIASSFVCIFFLTFVGRWVDRFGTKTMMFVDALTFIGVYLVYGTVVWSIDSGQFSGPWAIWVVYGLYILDRISMQFGMVKNIYLKDIAWSKEDITATLSMGTSLDHVVTIFAAILGGYVWSELGSQWVFYMAAAFSLGNLYVAIRVNPEKEHALALEKRAEAEAKEAALAAAPEA